MSRAVLRTSIAVLLGAALTSCSPIQPAPFSLRDGDGTEHALVPDLRLPAGREDIIGGGGPASVRYSPVRPVPVRGIRPALEIRYELSGSARLEVLPEGRGAAPILSADLARGAGLLQWVVPLPPGTAVAALRLSALPGGAGTGSSSLRVLGLEIRPAVYGFQRLEDGVRISRGASLARDAAAGIDSIRVEHPYGLEDRPVVRIESEGVRLRAWTEDGRSAVLDPAPAGAAYVPLGALGGYAAVVVEAEPDAVRSVVVLPAPEAPDPLPVDLAAVLALPPPEDPSRPYALYRWDAFPGCLVFDFRDYAVQDAYLKRLAFFVEKEGFRGRLAPDPEIARLHGWNAHDYRAEDLAAFFDLAGRTSFPLSVPETELQGILERQGILIREGGRIRPGTGAIISIARESSAYLRDLFLNHEASHALFFLDESYRNLARTLWRSQGPEERRFWNVFLSNRDYDPGDAYLSYNELQAYLVQQSPSRLESWLKDVAYARLARAYPDRADGILADLEAALPAFRAKAEALDAYLRKTYGFRGGSFKRVRFE